MKGCCLYTLTNIDNSCYCKQREYILDHHFILQKISYHFYNYISKIPKCIYLPFEKPNHFVDERYKIYRLCLHLIQWKMAKEERSLMQLIYAQIKRNPE